MDLPKLKVVELRAALAERGLDTKGNKPVLVERLRKALEEESQDSGYQEKSDLCTEDMDDTALKEGSERITEAARSSQPPRTPSRSSRSSSMVTPTKVSTRNALRTVTTPNSSKQSSPNKPQYIEKAREELMTISESTSEESVVQEEISKLSPEKYRDEQKDIVSNIQNAARTQLSEKSQEEEIKYINILKDERETDIFQVPAAEPSEKSSTIESIDQFSRIGEHHEAMESSIEVSKVKQLIAEIPIDDTKDVLELEGKTEIKKDINIDKIQDDVFKKDIEDKTSMKEEYIEHVEDMYNVKHNVDIPEVEQPTHVISDQVDTYNRTYDTELKDEEEINNDYIIQEEKIDVSINIKNVDEKMGNIDTSENEQEMAEMKGEDIKLDIEESNQKDCKDRKRKRSLSPSETHQLSPIPHKTEDEPDFDESAVILSWHDSDLNLIIDKEGFFSATPMHDNDFCHIWAGARASYGFSNGKVYYETKITGYCPITTTQDQDQSHMLRVGWSIPNGSMQLGEENFSYAYTSSGKKGTDKEFTEYGVQFGKDDIIGCYLDMTLENTVELFYTMNGKDLGSAFSISKEELGDRPLYPHILSKNCTFMCNFGQEESWCEQIPEYTLVGNIELHDRIVGPCRPDEKSDCEVIMICGLPQAGTTAWVRKRMVEHPDKLYNILGFDNLIEKTGDVALYQDQNPYQREIIDKCNRALDRLIDVASSRRRNYILDQRSNVYPSMQKRKMRNFYGYQRKAIIVIPAEEEYNQRLSMHDTGKNISNSNLMEMKANFTTPLVGEFFDTVEWVGLNEEEGKKLIEKYNKEGKEAGYGQQQLAKRPRLDKTEGNRETRDSRNNRDTRDHRDRRNSYQDRGRNPPWRGNNMGGWRGGDRPQRGYMRHVGGYGPPVPWRMRGRGGPIMRGADRRGGGIDRRPGNDRNRSTAARQGGWAPMSSNYQGSQQSSWTVQQDNWSSGQSQGGWGQQTGWGQQQWGGGGGGGSWKGYGSQGMYSQAGYNQQQGYGNGNWSSWNQQYYNNQYWNQQQQSGQTTAAGGQAEIANETIATTSTNTGAEYSYS